MIIAVMKSAYRNLKKLLFQASIHNCLNCVHNCYDHSLLEFKSTVQYMKHFIYHFTLISVQPFVNTVPLKINLHSQRTDFCSYFSYKRSSYYVIECVSSYKVVQSSDCVRNIYRQYFGVSVLYDFRLDETLLRRR